MNFLTRTHSMTTTINRQRCSSDEACSWTRQKRDDTGNFLDLSRSAESVSCLAVLEELCVSGFVHAASLMNVRDDDA